MPPGSASLQRTLAPNRSFNVRKTVALETCGRDSATSSAVNPSGRFSKHFIISMRGPVTRNPLFSRIAIKSGRVEVLADVVISNSYQIRVVPGQNNR